MKYTFPETYLEPINQTFSGAFEKLKLRFRLKKKETDIKQEAAIQNPPSQNNSNNQHGEFQSNNVNPDNIHIEIGESNQNKYIVNNNNLNNNNMNNNKYNYPGNNNHDNYLDQQEENLD